MVHINNSLLGEMIGKPVTTDVNKKRVGELEAKVALLESQLKVTECAIHDWLVEAQEYKGFNAGVMALREWLLKIVSQLVERHKLGVLHFNASNTNNEYWMERGKLALSEDIRKLIVNKVGEVLVDRCDFNAGRDHEKTRIEELLGDMIEKCEDGLKRSGPPNPSDLREELGIELTVLKHILKKIKEK